MPKSIQISSNARGYLQPKLQKHYFLHKAIQSVYLGYCSITGPFRVLPDFYLIGAAKSGTSSLFDYLIQHPSIPNILTKEPRYFDKYFHKGLNWYKACFPFKFQKIFSEKLLKKEFLVGEATPRYIDHPHAPHRIKKITPNAKFIVLLRNPIDRSYSHYNMRFSAKKEHLTFEQVLEKERTLDEFQKMVNDENYYSSEYYHHAYLDRSIYVDKLKRWMDVFPRERFLILKSEDFFTDTPGTYKKVLKFLNLPVTDLKEYKKINVGKYKQPKINPILRKELSDFFKPHNERLYKFLGTDFEWE